MIACIFEHVQWRWARNYRLAHGYMRARIKSRAQVSRDRGASWSEPADVPRGFGGAVEAASPLLVAAAAGRGAIT